MAQISLRSIRTRFKTLFSRVKTTKPCHVYFYTQNSFNLSPYLSYQKKKEKKKKRKKKRNINRAMRFPSKQPVVPFSVISSHGSCSSVSTSRHGSLESERGTHGFIPAGNMEKISVPVAWPTWNAEIWLVRDQTDERICSLELRLDATYAKMLCIRLYPAGYLRVARWTNSRCFSTSSFHIPVSFNIAILIFICSELRLFYHK